MTESTPLSFENIIVELSQDGIAIVSIDRPKALNALNDATMEELHDCFLALKDDNAVRVVIVTGTGEKAFVAGADISELADQGAAAGRNRARFGQETFSLIEGLGKPVLAAINGFALGGGCELALACHLRYASEKARLGLPEVTLGIIPGFGGTQRLQRLVGRGVALELALTGAMVKAPRALEIGLVNGVFPAQELLTQVQAIAKAMCSHGPIALRYVLEASLRGGDTDLAAACQIEADLFGIISETQDMREGMKAFLEKRSAEFKGC